MITKDQIEAFRQEKKTYQEIADYFHVSRQFIHQIYRDYSTVNDYLRKKIFIRDGFACIKCGSKSNVTVHHLDGDSKNNSQDNLITLCRKCHYKADSEERRSGNRVKAVKFFKAILVERVNKSCKKCGVIFSVLPSSKKIYCGFNCYVTDKPRHSPEERKKMHSASVAKWKAAHPYILEWQKKYLREYNKRPKVKERIRIKQKARYWQDVEKSRAAARERYHTCRRRSAT